jgi:Tol biopolymer transport system component
MDADCAACSDDPLHVADLSMISTGMNWSPDGRLLAYTAAPRGVGSAVYLADVSCADCPPTIHALSQPQHVDSSPVWSPDGRTLAFVSRFLNVGDIAIMDVNCIHQPAGCAGARRLLTQHNVDVWSAAWRPG